jgi:hypothetical protein
MKSITIILFLLTILNQQVLAFNVPDDCKKSKVSDCVACSTQTSKKVPFSNKIDVLTEPMLTLGNFAYLEEKVSRLSKVNEALKKSLIPLFRTLRDGTSEPTYKASSEEIKNIKIDFDRLTVLSKETIILQKKFNICLNNCSAMMKLEIQDELTAIQKIKTALFIKQPLLANKAFEERMLSISDSMIDNEQIFSDKIFEKDLKDTLLDNLGKIANRADEYYKFENDEKKPYNRKGNGPYIKEYIGDVSSRFPGVMEDLVKSSLYDGGFSDQKTKESACFYAEQFKNYSIRKEYKEMAVDTGLFILPLFAGPLGRAGAMGAELAFGERLAVWGVKSIEAKKTLSAASMVFQAGIVGKDLEQLKDLFEECRRSEVVFLSKSDEAQLKEFRDCQKKLGEKIFVSELGLISLGTISISTSAIKFLSKGVQGLKLPLVASKEVKNTSEISGYILKNGLDELKKGQVSMEFATPDSGVFSIMDLSAVVKTQDPIVRKIPEEYWRYVGSIYSERLNLTKTEIEGFIKSSVEMSPRTKLVLNTEKSPLTGKMKINGGVGIVHASSPEELLPLEKATGIRIDKKPNEKIVEIVRLTVGKDIDAEKVSTALVNQASSLIVQDKSISRVFIFTSKAHARLYKKMGVPTDNIKNIDKRDVIIEFTRSDLERVLEKKILMEKASSYLPDRLRISSMMAYIWSNGMAPSILAPLIR